MAKTFDMTSEEYRLGQRIRTLRESLGLSQTAFAGLMNMDRSAISNYENGTKGEMGFKTLLKFARALGVTPDVLLGEIDEGVAEIVEVYQKLNDENQKTVLKTAKAFQMTQSMGA